LAGATAGQVVLGQGMTLQMCLFLSSQMMIGCGIDEEVFHRPADIPGSEPGRTGQLI